MLDGWITDRSEGVVVVVADVADPITLPRVVSAGVAGILAMVCSFHVKNKIIYFFLYTI
jgi:hypothetical protein